MTPLDLDALAKVAEDIIAESNAGLSDGGFSAWTALQLISQLRKHQEAVRLASDAMDLVATAVDDTDSTGTERFAYQRLRDALQSIARCLE